MFDTHAHYDDAAFDTDRDELLSSLPQRGVSLIMNAACSVESSKESAKLANRYDFVYAAAGIHPDSAGEAANSAMDEIKSIVLSNKKVKAIGEIGLDYHYDVERDLQKRAFDMQLSLARELSLPVIIHDRDAHKDCLDMVRSAGVTGVFHCFSGSVQTARELLDLGFYISFAGVVTFKNARVAKEVAAFVPLDRILIETDAPYLSPEPNRGKRNDSSNLIYTARAIAELKNMDEDEFVFLAELNGKNLFDIEG